MHRRQHRCIYVFSCVGRRPEVKVPHVAQEWLADTGVSHPRSCACRCCTGNLTDMEVGPEAYESLTGIGKAAYERAARRTRAEMKKLLHRAERFKGGVR